MKTMLNLVLVVVATSFVCGCGEDAPEKTSLKSAPEDVKLRTKLIAEPAVLPKARKSEEVASRPPVPEPKPGKDKLRNSGSEKREAREKERAAEREKLLREKEERQKAIQEKHRKLEAERRAKRELDERERAAESAARKPLPPLDFTPTPEPPNETPEAREKRIKADADRYFKARAKQREAAEQGQ